MGRGQGPAEPARFIDDGEEVRLVKVAGTQERGRELVARMRGRASTRLTTEEIMALTRGEG